MVGIKTVGILGGGQIGQVLAEHLVPDYADIYMHDKNEAIQMPANVTAADFGRVATCDVIYLGTPIQSYDDILPRLTKLSPEHSMIVNLCSSQVLSNLMFRRLNLHLRENVLNCHPNFGPNSVLSGLEGQQVYITHQRGELADETTTLWQAKGIRPFILSDRAHDWLMSRIQVPRFFMTKTLIDTSVVDQLPDWTESAEGYLLPVGFTKTIQEWVEVGKSHSKELDETVLSLNPFAIDVKARIALTSLIANTKLAIDLMRDRETRVLYESIDLPGFSDDAILDSILDSLIMARQIVQTNAAELANFNNMLVNEYQVTLSEVMPPFYGGEQVNRLVAELTVMINGFSEELWLQIGRDPV